MIMAKSKKVAEQKVDNTQLKNQIIKAYMGRVACMDDKPVSKKDIMQIVNLTFGSITKDLMAGKSVYVSGIGKFGISHRKARKGRNPQTGKALTVKAHNSPVFKASAPLKRIVNLNN